MEVGEVAKLEDEERRDRLGRGESAPALLCADRSDAVDDRFFRLEVDFRRSSRSSLRELELAVRRGAGCARSTEERAGTSGGDSNEDGDGEAGRGVAAAEAIVKWFRLLVKSLELGVGGGGGAVNVAWRGSSRMEGSIMAIEVAFER